MGWMYVFHDGRSYNIYAGAVMLVIIPVEAWDKRAQLGDGCGRVGGRRYDFYLLIDSGDRADLNVLSTF